MHYYYYITDFDFETHWYCAMSCAVKSIAARKFNANINSGFALEVRLVNDDENSAFYYCALMDRTETSDGLSAPLGLAGD